MIWRNLRRYEIKKNDTLATGAEKTLRGLCEMNNIDNPLSEYQPSPEEALRNFGIDISREAVEKYALEKFGRLPQSHIEMTSARDSKIIDETRRSMNNENINTKNSARDSFDKGNYGILHIVTADELKNC